MSLPNRIKRQPLVLPYHFTRRHDNLPRLRRYPLHQKLFYRHLANETNPHAFFFLGRRQIKLSREFTDFFFSVITNRKENSRELVLRKLVEKISLIFIFVFRCM